MRRLNSRSTVSSRSCDAPPVPIESPQVFWDDGEGVNLDPRGDGPLIMNMQLERHV
jgi:hypothetical protein